MHINKHSSHNAVPSELLQNKVWCTWLDDVDTTWAQGPRGSPDHRERPLCVGTSNCWVIKVFASCRKATCTYYTFKHMLINTIIAFRILTSMYYFLRITCIDIEHVKIILSLHEKFLFSQCIEEFSYIYKSTFNWKNIVTSNSDGTYDRGLIE